MKRYENPIINVSLFDIENIVTSSGEVQAQTAVQQAAAAAKELTGAAEDKVLTVTF